MRKYPPGVIAAALIVVMFLWGGSFIAIKIGLRHLSPYELVMARFVPSALMLLPIGLIAGRRSGRGGWSFWRGLNRRELFEVTGASLMAVPVYHTCLNFGETLIPAGWASLVISLNPAFIVLFSSILLHEQVTFKRWAGIGVAFAGLSLITLGQDAPNDLGTAATAFQKGLGVTITLGAVISWGAFTTISKKLIAGRDPLENLGWIMGLGALWSLPAYNSEFTSHMAAGGWELWLALGFLSAGCTVFAFVIWFWALEQWSASRTGAFIYLVPIFALGIGFVVLREAVTGVTIIGAAGVLGGVVLASGDKRAGSSAQTAPEVV